MNKLAIFLIPLLLLLLLVTGGCEEELTAFEVLERSMESAREANASEFSLEMRQDMSFDGDSMSSVMKAQGKMTEVPYAMEMKMETDMMGMAMDMEMYLADDVAYMYMPMVGWVKENVDESIYLAHAYEDPYQYMHMLQQVEENEAISMELVEGFYNLSYEDIGGVLAALIMDEMRTQMGVDLFGDPEVEDMIDDISISNLKYSLSIDEESFLPGDATMTFDMSMAFMDMVIDIAQDVQITYHSFGDFEQIIIPDEVLNEAVFLDEIF